MQQPTPGKKTLPTIIVAWLIAGTLDICSALILVGSRGKNPIIVFNYISSAVFGQDAYTGGTAMIIAGLLFHYLIALIFTVILFVFYPKIYAVLKNKYLIAVVYGLFNWIVMNLVVVPLTRIGFHAPTVSGAIQNIIILMIAIGLPVSLIAYRFYYGKSSNQVV